MIVCEIGREEPVQVFGIYWVGQERFYWVIPYESYGGFMVLSDREVNVVDSFLSSDLIICKEKWGRIYFLKKWGRIYFSLDE